MITQVTEDTGESNSDRITNDPTLFLSGTAEANSVVELTRLGVGVIGTTTANAAGSWSFDYTGTTLPEGMHNFTARASIWQEILARRPQFSRWWWIIPRLWLR